MLNFCQGVKHVPALLAKNYQRRLPISLHVFGRALVIYNTVLCWKLSHRLRDILLLSIPWPWNSGSGSLKVIGNYKTKTGTHDFLLTFHSHHRPISHRFLDIGHFRLKSPTFPIWIPLAHYLLTCTYLYDDGLVKQHSL